MALTASGLSPALPWGREWPSSRPSSASSHKEEAYRWLQKGLDAPSYCQSSSDRPAKAGPGRASSSVSLAKLQGRAPSGPIYPA